MKFLIKNIKLMFNYKVSIVFAVCFIINIFYSFNNFSQVLEGVKGEFNLFTAIPWIALLFPFFLLTGAYFSNSDEIYTFVIIRKQNLINYYLIYYLTIIFTTLFYCLLYFFVAIILGGNMTDVFLSVLLIGLSLLFLSSVQLLIYSIKKNALLSIGVVLAIILFALVFPNSKLSIGSWAMLIRSNLKSSMGYNVMLTSIIQIVLTIIFNAFTIVFNRIKKVV